MDNRIDAQEKAKADIFEAILGAIAISCQWDPEILQNVVKKMISIEAYLTELESDRCRTEDLSADNAVNTLKEMEEHGMCSFLIYEFNLPEELGYDEDGNPKWVCCCTMIKWGLKRQVWVSSKKYAAYLVLCEHLEVENEYGSSRGLDLEF